jgi:DNA-binding GntR family transcriptional regulator
VAEVRRSSEVRADHPDQGLASGALADRYGLGAHTTAKKAMPRLARRGLVERTDKDRWKIIDPFLAEWQRQNSPFGE